MQLKKTAATVLKRLNDASFSAYAVGGAVRDLLMGKHPNDYDIATNARYDDISALFGKENVIPTGIKHGTVTLIFEGERFEITSFRSDGAYLDSRHPNEVVFINNVEGDLMRRDLTVNAIAYNETDGIVDPHDGRLDIKNKLLRAVGDPFLRFSEDALRIMRTVRFASTLGFEIEESTSAAMRECLPLLSKISGERIFSELLLFLSGDFREVLSKHHYVFSELFPDWVMPCTDHRIVHGDKIALLAYFFSGCSSESALLYLERLKADNVSKRFTLELLSALGHEEIKTLRSALRFRSKYSDKTIERYLLIVGRNKEASLLEEAKNRCHKTEMLEINGTELVSLGYRNAEIGRALKLLLEAVIENKVENKKEKLILFLSQHEDDVIY